eukprot:m.473963 g.473963  ORF g.473963 m.473963 type:complete len:811 (+) comp57131_c0_seq12:1541-3973(+)
MVSLESAVVVANLAAGSVSLLLSLLSMLLTHLTLRVDRDPARLLRYRALFDALIGCLYIGTSIYFLLDSNTSDASRICEVIQFMQTFFETATSMWLVMIAIDLYRVMTNPFRVPKHNFKVYACVVTLSTVGLTLLNYFFGNAPSSVNEACWISQHDSSTSTSTTRMIINFFPWVSVIVFCFSFGLWMHLYRKTRHGIAVTLITRKRALTVGFRYLAVFSFWVFAVMVLWAVQFGVTYGQQLDKTTSPTFLFLYASIAIAGRGVTTFIAIRRILPRSVSLWKVILTHCCCCFAWMCLLRSPQRYADSDDGEARTLLFQRSRSTRSGQQMRRSASSASSSPVGSVVSSRSSSLLPASPTSLQASPPRQRGLLHLRLASINGPSTSQMQTIVELHSPRESEEVFEEDGGALVDPLDDEEADDGSDTDSFATALRNDIMTCTAQGIIETTTKPSVSDATVRQVLFPASTNSVRRFDFVDYRPAQFARLRLFFGLDAESYLSSFTLPSTGERPGDATYTAFHSAFSGGGRSGSFMYYTRDRRFIVKSLSVHERRVLLNFVPQLLKHVFKYPSTIITKFCGVYSVRLSPEQPFVSFVVMSNIFAETGSLLDTTRRYDLKGSVIGRSTSSSESPSASQASTDRVLKDLDCLFPFVLAAPIRAALLAQIAVDVELLRAMNIMDYSLLVGLHSCSSSCTHAPCLALPQHSTPMPTRMSTSATTSRAASFSEPELCLHSFADGIHCQHGDGEFVCVVGIIDCLQIYDLSKKAERLFKTAILCHPGDALSVIDTQRYARRFMDKMSECFQADTMASYLERS